ncbi:hypothetical protein LR48_Vigan10g276100 [Vigna angularis]|uniref:Myb/SANT-like domain-containing protein n=1 Tax=Phaseolus angularis TaxID=3914 RepID=A0A0L9VQ43_PHAAN|nr:hypothetical protein LR48_Vigan10g276100 [Vigna angularis]
MNRGKAAALESSAPTREFMKWTKDMDARLLHSMIDESRIGNRVDGSWTSQAYSNIVDHLHSSGYSRPTAEKWRVNCIKHYDLMVELWAADRATRSGVRTARQARRQRVGPRVSVDLNQNIEYIPEQPQWAGFRDPTPPSPPPSVDEYSPGQTQSVPSVPSGSRHHFSINSLKRMKIVNVNGVWQHDLDDDEEEEDQPDPHQNPVQPPLPLSNPNMMTQMWEGVQDLRHIMHMEQMQVRVQRIEDNLANLSLDMNRQFAHLNQNVNLILHRLDD